VKRISSIVAGALLAVLAFGGGQAAAAITYSIDRITPLPIEPGDDVEFEVTIESPTPFLDEDAFQAGGAGTDRVLVSETGDSGNWVSCAMETHQVCFVDSGFTGTVVLRFRETTGHLYQRAFLSLNEFTENVYITTPEFDVARGGPSSLAVTMAPGAPTPTQLRAATGPVDGMVRISNTGAGTAWPYIAFSNDEAEGFGPPDSLTCFDVDSATAQHCALASIPPGGHLDVPIRIDPSKGAGSLSVEKQDGADDAGDVYVGPDGVTEPGATATGAGLSVQWARDEGTGPTPSDPSPQPPAPIVPNPVAPTPTTPAPTTPKPPTLDPGFRVPGLQSALRSGIVVPVRCNATCRVTSSVVVTPRLQRALKLRSNVLASGTGSASGAAAVRVRNVFSRPARAALAARRGAITATLRLRVASAGRTTTITRAITLR
jgi:hypothetical protein